MARTKQNQRSATRVAVPMGATGGRTPPSKLTMALLSTSVVSAVWAAAMLTPAGRIAYVYLFTYSAFYMGVLALVSLSITIMLGLVATDRMVLSVRQRVLMQSAHRTTGIIAVGSLVVHVMTKLSLGLVGVVDVFIPFLARNQTLYVGLGTTAAFCMVSVLWTGIVRAKFAGRGKPWMWRSLHSISYLSWPIALVHGLSVGRAAAGWVIAAYVVCVLLVLVALAVRLSVSLGRRKNFSSTAAGSLKPVGKLVPAVTAGTKARSKRRTDRRIEVEVAPIAAHVVAARPSAPAAVESWVPAKAAGAVGAGAVGAGAGAVGAGAVALVSARPSVRRDEEVESRPARSVRRDEELEYRPTRSARRDYDDEPVEPRRRPAEPAVGYADEEPVRSRRRYVEDDEPVVPRSRRRTEPGLEYDPRSDVRPAARPDPDARYDELPAQRSRQRYAEDEPVVPRRYAAEDDDTETPRRRRSAESDLREPAPRQRWSADDEAVVPRSRSTEITRYSPDPRARNHRYPEQEESAPRSRRYEEGGARYDQAPAARPSRYADDVEAAPRSRRVPVDRVPMDRVPVDRAPMDRAGTEYGYPDRGDSGRHSRVVLPEPADPWGADRGADPNYLPPDDTPTLVDMASRRARRVTAEVPPAAGRAGARRARSEQAADDLYFRQLRGEAQ